MTGIPLTPILSPSLILLRLRGREGWGQAEKQPFTPRQRRERGARASGRVRGRRNRSVGASIFLALILALALAGCGKRNAPEPPPGVPDTYPRPYPSE